MSAVAILGAWLVLNLLGMLVAVRRSQQRREPAPDPARADYLLAVHVWMATPDVMPAGQRAETLRLVWQAMHNRRARLLHAHLGPDE